jgi:hypothetical protein
MKFVLEIHCNNAAFDDSDEGRAEEVGRILAEAAKKVADGFTYIYLTDYNGNTVGTASFTGD